MSIFNDDEMGGLLATQAFLEETKARAALFHHSTKTQHEIKQLPFTLGRAGNVTTTDPDRKPDMQLCSRVHATIKEEGNSFALHSHGPHGTAILRRGVTINIPVEQREILEDGDGIKLGSLNDPGYRAFIYTFSLPNQLEPKEIKCEDCQNYFQFSAGEQQFYKRKGFKDPFRCSDCRDIKKRARETSGQENSGHYGPGQKDQGKEGGEGGKMKRGKRRR